MLLTVEEAVATLDHLGLFPEVEARELLAAMVPAERPEDGAALIAELARRGRLTTYQADALRDRPPKPLLLSNYLLLEPIGAGGMGRVFRALHRRMERTVALKLLHERSLGSTDAVERFHREVRAAARLHHPNIVTAFDADEACGLHFFVMEYVDGPDLGKLVKQGPLPLEKALAYIAQAARGLEYAHAEGVVHRDIKPANLLLSSKGVVKILDLGIARLAEVSDPTGASTQPELTQAGAILGTVDFMAPEQAIDSKTADHRADIYSLGCTLYFLLTGSAPYAGKNVVEKIVAHREREVPSLRALRPDAPPGLEDLVRRMMAKTPEHRNPTMADAAQALEALLEQAGPSWSAEFEMHSTVTAPQDASPQAPTVTMEFFAETFGGSRTNAVQAVERFIDGCAAIDGYFDVDEEHAVFRKGGELGLAREDISAILDRRCEAHGWIRYSALTARLEKMLAELAADGRIDQREFNQLIRHAVDSKMPRRRAEEHCLTLMLDRQWPAREPFWNRWFTRRCRKYGLE
jgi:serine/threonine protein kinase